MDWDVGTLGDRWGFLQRKDFTTSFTSPRLLYVHGVEGRLFSPLSHVSTGVRPSYPGRKYPVEEGPGTERFHGRWDRPLSLRPLNPPPAHGIVS